MADIKQEHKPEDAENYAMANNTDPKNMQELTQFVSPQKKMTYEIGEKTTK